MHAGMQGKQCKSCDSHALHPCQNQIKPGPKAPLAKVLKISVQIILVAPSSSYKVTEAWGLCSPGAGGEQGSTWVLIHARPSHHLSATRCPCEAVRVLQDHWVHRDPGHNQVHYMGSHQAVRNVMLSAQSPQAPENRLQTRVLAPPGGVQGKHRGSPPCILQPDHPSK